jgi:hypothetical protein
MYRHLVNRAVNLHPQIEINDDDKDVGNERIVKFVETKFKTMPVGVPEFDHFKPAEYLLGIDEQANGIPGLDEALERFEKLFNRLNGLLPPPSA